MTLQRQERERREFVWRDNVFIERLWRSVKYEEVYLHAYETFSDSRNEIGKIL